MVNRTAKRCGSRWSCLATFLCAAFAGCGPQGEPPAVLGTRVEGDVRPAYPCHRASAPLRIDGVLSEAAWKQAPVFALAETASGKPAPRRYAVRLLRDEQYLYVGFEIEDPDVWARVGYHDDEVGRAYALIANHHKCCSKEWQRIEADIHSIDKFVKLFFDPDGDGENYVEFHLNPLNNRFDACYARGYEDPKGGTSRGEDVGWTCAGLITATHVDGTLNAPHDRDKGWSAEMAIPWTSLARFSKAPCPPAESSAWLLHLGYIDRPGYYKPRTYWTWPVIGVVQSHMPKTWGRLVFTERTLAPVAATPAAAVSEPAAAADTSDPAPSGCAESQCPVVAQ